MKNVVGAVAAALIMSGAAQASTVLNFDGNTTPDGDGGTAIFSGANNLTGYDVTFNGVLYRFGISHDLPLGSASGANLFDTSACDVVGQTTTACNNGDDLDLVPANQGENGIAGNVLIRQEATPGTTTPRSLDDDAAGSGSITFTLLEGEAFSLTGFSGVDDGTFSLTVGGSTIATLSPGGNSDTAEAALFVSPLISVGGTNTFTFNFVGSGGIDSIALAPVPLPAALPLLLVGVGGLALFGRRRSSATTA